MVAPRILWRYILRDVLLHTALGLAVFSMLLVGQNLLRFLEELLATGVSAAALGQLMLIVLPSYLAYAIPVSLLFGVLLTFGRMSADGEVIAMRAAGVSVPRLLPPVVVIGAVFAVFTTYLLFELEPASRHKLKSFVRELGRSMNVVEVGRFRILGSRTVYIAKKGDETCPFQGVLIGDLSEALRPMYISARCAALDPEASSGLALKLSEGSIHFSDERADRYRRISFDQMTIALDLDELFKSTKRADEYTFAELLELRSAFKRGETPEVRGEDGASVVETQIHRRLAFPLASVLLGVLAVPLGIRPLRAGRSAGAITAVGVMACYWVLFSAGEAVAERGLAPAWLCIWLPNVLVLTLSIFLIRATTRGDS